MRIPTPTEVYLLILFSKITKVLQRGFEVKFLAGKKGENLKISRNKQKRIKMVTRLNIRCKLYNLCHGRHTLASPGPV